MYAIAKEFHFSASHQLLSLPDDHPCHRLHGHNYLVSIVLTAEELDAHGFVLDYNALEPFRRLLDTQLDHRHLNDVLPVEPTAENLARWLYDAAVPLYPHARVSCIRVSETSKTWAEYVP